MIAVAFRAAVSKFYSYGGGIIDDPELCNTRAIDHAVVMVGYVDQSGDNDYFVLRNSWGKNWGDNGYFYVHKDCVMGLYSYPSAQAIF